MDPQQYQADFDPKQAIHYPTESLLPASFAIKNSFLKTFEQQGLMRFFPQDLSKPPSWLAQAIEQLKTVRRAPQKTKFPGAVSAQGQAAYTNIDDALIWEFGLDVLRPYVDDLAAHIEHARDWHRYRGTPYSLARGLKWLGFEEVKVTSFSHQHFFHYQVQLDKVVRDHRHDDVLSCSMPASCATARIHDTQEMCRLSAPARAHLARLHNVPDEEDVGVLTLSGQKARSGFGQMLSDYQGVVHETGVRLCFVEKYKSQISLSYQTQTAMHRQSVTESDIEVTTQSSRADNRVMIAQIAQPQWSHSWSERTWDAAIYATSSEVERNLVSHTDLELDLKPQSSVQREVVQEQSYQGWQAQVIEQVHRSETCSMQQRQWFGRWDTTWEDEVTWETPMTVVLSEQNRYFTHSVQADIHQQDADCSAEGQHVVWDVQLNQVQHRSSTEALCIAQHDWFGTWSTGTWAEQDVVGDRASRHHVSSVQADVTLSQSCTGHNQHDMTWELDISTLSRHATRSEQLSIQQRQWFGRWDTTWEDEITWETPMTVVLSEQNRYFTHSVQADIHQQDADCSAEGQHVVWDVQLNQVQHRSSTEALCIAQHDWFGTWSTGTWAEQDVVGDRASRHHVSSVQADVTLSQSCTGHNQHDMTWELDISTLSRHATRSEQLSMQQRQWFGRWDTTWEEEITWETPMTAVLSDHKKTSSS